MADTKTFKDIDKKLQKLVDETKENFKITKRWQAKLDDHAIDLIDNVENDRKPRAKVQQEMLRVLETTESQSKVRAQDQLAADFKTGKATIEQLKAGRLSKEDFVKSGFGAIGSNIEMMRQWWQETVGRFGVAVKNWWKWTKENSIVLQSAKKFWNSEAIKKLRGMVSQVANIVQGHLSDILGEFQQVFDFFKQSISLIYKSITGAFTGMFDIVSKRRQQKREQKMVDYLQKIKDGIGFMVKGTKLEAYQTVKKGKAGFIDKILDMLGLGGLLAGGAGALLAGLKIALIGLVTKFIFDAINGAIEGWKKDGLRGALVGYFTGLTKLPRRIIGWIGEKILNWFGKDGAAFREALSDENTKKFIKDVIDSVTTFVKDLTNFVNVLFLQVKDGIANLWNDWMPWWMPKAASGTGENLSDAQSTFKRSKGFNTGTQTGAQSVITLLDIAKKKAEQAAQDLKLRKERGENVDEQVKQLKELNRNIKESRETQIQIQQQSNTVNSGNSGGASVINPDLMGANSADTYGPGMF